MAVTQSKTTKKYRAEVYVARDAARRRGPWRRLKSEARADERRLLQVVHDEAPFRSSEPPTTVDRWVRRYMRNPDWAPKTRARYEAAWRHVPSIFLDLLLDRVTPVAYDDMLRKIKNPHERRKVHQVDGPAFKLAARQGRIRSTPTTSVTVPMPRADEVKPPSQNEVVRIIDAVPAEWKVFVHLAATTGLRPGEVCGLRWEDVDGSDLNVRRGVTTVGSDHHVGPLKTERSRRRIAVDAGTAQLLAALPHDRSGYVFPGEHGDGFCLPASAAQAFKRAARRLGLPYTLYDLRHYHASVLLHARPGEMVAVSKRLGHSTVTQTLNVYAHLLPGADAALADLGALPSPKE